jgi:hypothetical protein
MNGVVVAQLPAAGTRLTQWDVVTVWVTDAGDPSGVREPRRPLPTCWKDAAAHQPDAE